MAEEYDRWRPSYLAAAVDWLSPAPPARVVEIGAGTGRLTSLLVVRDLEVDAVEPDPRMRAVLTRNNPAARCHAGDSTTLPVEDASVEAVLVADAWHWFDPLATPDELEFAQFDWTWDLTPAHRAANLATTSMAIAMAPVEREKWLESARAELQDVCEAAGRDSMPIRQQASCTRWTPEA